MSRVVFVNRFYYPDESATSQMLTDLAAGLARRGLNVMVVTSRLRIDEPGADLPPREIQDGVDIHRVRTSRFGRANMPGRALDYLTFYLFAAVVLLRLLRAEDVLVVKTDPPMFSVIAARIARRRSARLVNWLQDLYPETASALGVLPEHGRIVRLLARWRNRALQAADLNVAIGEHMAAFIRALGIADERVAVIPNWADGAAIAPLAHSENPLRREWFPDDAFVVAYSGNMGRAHDLSGLLAAAAQIAATAAHPGGETAARVCFLFIGGGHQQRALRAEARRRGLSNIVFRPFQPRTRLRESLGVADLHVVALKPVLEGLVVPSKVYGALAAGRPVLFLGARNGEIGRLLTAHACGIPVAPDAPRAIAETILAHAADPERCHREGNNARRLFEGAMHRDTAVQRWACLLNPLTGQTTR
jgi:colanic acid biosynthesis glycosyl transferase WcaI